MNGDKITKNYIYAIKESVNRKSAKMYKQNLDPVKNQLT